MKPNAATHLRYVVGDPSPYGNPEERLDLATAPAYQLFFSCFMGDVDLVIGDAGFSTKFGWVSTLSFAIGMLRAIRELPERKSSQIGFLESEDRIEFQLEDSSVRVSSSYSADVATIVYDELLELAGNALTDLLVELTSRFPTLRENPSLAVALGNPES
ncbi:hypothetical protein EV643_107277 [Kribbella sp. VKM Ac-2527]|uniref:Uncharacterized protein n=1 Tax=Kribbella caucasensis TaxID=2512215 RepID=A0A4R6KEE4_9ACTN|nr:hypothetical protein [Kribbella sp. VKM Ac-2527]TDO48647.1 hypothetical protein EV643_107277 [Kribbella sp. VKM Ac-2527]